MFKQSSMSLVIFFVLLGFDPVSAVFYRNIPFRLKSVAEATEEQNSPQIGGENASIRDLLDQIEEEAMRLAAEGIVAKEEREEGVRPAPRRTVRLIPLRMRDVKQPRATSVHRGEGDRVKGTVSSSASPLHSHLMALRPDYAFRNVADVLRSFFDSRIERHSRRSAAGGSGKAKGN